MYNHLVMRLSSRKDGLAAALPTPRTSKRGASYCLVAASESTQSGLSPVSRRIRLTVWATPLMTLPYVMTQVSPSNVMVVAVNEYAPDRFIVPCDHPLLGALT